MGYFVCACAELEKGLTMGVHKMLNMFYSSRKVVESPIAFLYTFSLIFTFY